MTDRIADSVLYRHLWGTDEARAVLGEDGRLRGWLEVLVTLARVQAEAGLIPAAAARLIACAGSAASSGGTCAGSRSGCSSWRRSTGPPSWRAAPTGSRAAR